MKLDPALLVLAAVVAVIYFAERGAEKRRVSSSAKGVCLPCERAAGRA
jgi:hypothetical protein